MANYKSAYTGAEIDAGIAKANTALQEEQYTGTYNKPANGIPKSDLSDNVQSSLEKADSAYQKPNTGIPEEDLSDAVKQKLNSGGVYTTLYTFNEAYANWCSGQQFPILICGDSTIAGRGTTDELGKTKAWVKRLEEKLKYECNNQNIKLYNVAVSGSSLPEPSTFDTWFGPNGAYNDSKMVGIGWGINDRLSYQNKKAYYEGVYSKVKALIEKAFSLNIQPFLITSQSTMESNVSQQYSSQYPLRNAENINTYANNAKRDLAKEYNIEVVDLNESTEIYLKKSNVEINTIIPDKLHFADRGNLFEAGAVFTKMVSRTIVVNQKDETILSYADQHITNAVKQDDLSYGGNLKVYTSYTKSNTTDQKIFDAYVYIKDTQATITAYKTSLESSTYVIIDNEVPEDKQTVSLTTLETALSDLEIGLHHLEVYTGESTKVDFAGFVINKIDTTPQVIPVQSIAFNPNTYTTGVDQPVQTSIDFTPSNATNKNVTYSATGGTITSSGQFLADTEGTYTITATSEDGNKTAICTVSVVTPIAVTGVSLDRNTANTLVNETLQLNATVAPANATNKTVTWSSSDTTIATVSNSGLVTGIGAGNATITVTTVDGGFTDTCAVTVAPTPVETKIYDTTGSSLSEIAFTVNNESGFFYPNYDSNDLTTSLSGKTITKIRAKLSFTGNSATMSYGRATLTGNATSLSDIVETKTVTVLKSEQDSNGYVTMDLGSLHIGEHETLSIGNPDGTDTAKPYFLDADSSNLPGRALLTKNHTYGSMSIGYSCQIWGYDN